MKHFFLPSVLSMLISVCLPIVDGPSLSGQEISQPQLEQISRAEAISIGVDQLLKIQNDDGAWPYEGVYRVNRKIPVGYRIGGTAICCQALMYATESNNQAANDAIKNGVELILKELEHPLMKPSQKNTYDVRVWGHIYALDLFCRMKESSRFPKLIAKLEPWIPKLVETLLFEELETGGWNYANRRAHAGFVTVPAVQSLLWARQVGQKIPKEVWKRSAEALLRSRNDKAAFAYSGDERESRPSKLPGSIARSANCEATLSMLGLPRHNPIKFSLDAFHEHWDELEKRRKKNGTHKPPYGVAPYYFYYGHRYAAFAIQQLPKPERAAEQERLFQVILRTRDPDGTWNDRVFARSRAYGTAMTVLALLEDNVPQPLALISVWIDPALITPQLKVKLSFDGTVTMGDHSVALSELESWFNDHPIEQKLNCVVISISGETKTRDAEKLKTLLREQVGETSMYFEVKD